MNDYQSILDHGCGDRNCLFVKRLGMVTNGGCLCISRSMIESLHIAVKDCCKLQAELEQFKTVARELAETLEGYADTAHWVQEKRSFYPQFIELSDVEIQDDEKIAGKHAREVLGKYREVLEGLK